MSSLTTDTDSLSDADLDAAQRAADGEIESLHDAPGAVSAAPSEADHDDPAPDGSAPANGDPDPVPATPAADPRPAGVSSKDGSKVMPYRVLQTSRRETQHERAARQSAERERDDLRQQLDASGAAHAGVHDAVGGDACGEGVREAALAWPW